MLLPCGFLSSRVEEWLNFVVLVVKLKFFGGHVGMTNLKCRESKIRLTLFLINKTLLFR